MLLSKAFLTKRDNTKKKKNELLIYGFCNIDFASRFYHHRHISQATLAMMGGIDEWILQMIWGIAACIYSYIERHFRFYMILHNSALFDACFASRANPK